MKIWGTSAKVWWCEEHQAESLHGDNLDASGCWLANGLAQVLVGPMNTPCRMVQMQLLRLPLDTYDDEELSRALDWEDFFVEDIYRSNGVKGPEAEAGEEMIRTVFAAARELLVGRLADQIK